MKFVNDEVTCGYKKWIVGISENENTPLSLYVKLRDDAIQGVISLKDMSADDLRNLGEMCLSAARTVSSRG